MYNNNKLRLNIFKDNQNNIQVKIISDNNNLEETVLNHTFKCDKEKFISANVTTKNKMHLKTTADGNQLLVKFEDPHKHEEVCFHVDTSANVVLNRTRTQQDLSINSSGNLTIEHADFHCPNLSLSANKIINYGILDVKKNVVLDAKQDITNTPSGKIQVGERLDSHANLTNQGIICGTDKLLLDMHNQNLLNSEQKNKTETGSISAKNDLTIIHAKKIDNQSSIKTLGAKSTLKIQANHLDNHKSIYSNGSIDLENSQLLNGDKAASIIAKNELNIKSDEILNDNLLSGGVLKITADGLINREEIKFQNSAEIKIKGLCANLKNIRQIKNGKADIQLNVNHMENRGNIVANEIYGKIEQLKNYEKIYSKNAMDLHINTFENYKDIRCANNLKLQVDNENSHNFGVIEAVNSAVLNASRDFQNYNLIRSLKEDVCCNSEGDFENYGQTIASQNCSIQAKNKIQNKGFIVGKKKCSIIANEKIENIKNIYSRKSIEINTATLDNCGKILTKGMNDIENKQSEVQIHVAKQLNNQEQGLISSKAKLNLVVDILNNRGQCEARDYLNLEANSTENDSTLNCTGKLQIKSKEFNNNKTGEIIAGEDLDLNGDNLKNSGSIESDANINFQINSNLENLKNISCKNELSMQGKMLVNDKEAYILSEKSLSIKQEVLINNGVFESPESKIESLSITNNGKMHSDIKAIIQIENKFQQNGELSSEEIMVSGDGELLNTKQITANSKFLANNKMLTNQDNISSQNIELKNIKIINDNNIFAEKLLEIDTEVLSNTEAGRLDSNNDMVIRSTKTLDQNGIIQAVGELKISVKSGQFNHGTGTIAANKDIFLEADNYRINSEIISQEGTVTINGGEFNNNAKIIGKTITGDVKTILNKGKCTAQHEIKLNASESIINDGQFISADNKVLLTAKDNIQQNNEIIAVDALLSAGHIINNGDIKVKNNVCLNAQESISTNKSISCEDGDIHLKSAKQLNLKGLLNAKDIILESKSLDLKHDLSAKAKIKINTDQDLNNNCKLSADEIEVSANAVSNNGSFEANNSFSILNTNTFINNGLVGSRGTVNIHARSQITNEKDAQLMSTKKMTLKTKKLLVQSSKIYSKDDIELDIDDIDITRNIAINRGVSGNNEKKDILQSADKPGIIYSEKNIILNINKSARNYASCIYAGDNINVKGAGKANVQNIPENLYVSNYVQVGVRKGHRKLKKGGRRSKHPVYRWTTPTVYQIIPATVCSQNVKLGNINLFDNQGLMEGQIFSFDGITFYNGRKDNLGGGFVQLPQQTLELIPHFQPNSLNALYQYHNQNSNRHYVVTAKFLLEPNLIDLRGFLMQENAKMLRTLSKKRLLGDIAYTADLMQLASFNSTGRPYLEKKMMEMICTKQVNHYLNNAMVFQRNNPAIKMGKHLSNADLQKITEPVLWPIKAKIGGQEKIVSFNIYLPQNLQQNLYLQDDGQIQVDKASIVAEQQITNTAYMTVTDELSIICQDFLNAPRAIDAKEYAIKDRGFFRRQRVQEVNVKKTQRGGEIHAGKLRINARNNITNRGHLLTQKELELIAANNIINQPSIDQSVVTWNIGSIGKLTGKVKSWDVATHFVPGKIQSQEGKIHLLAGNQIHNIGSLIEAREDILLEAQKLVMQDVACSKNLKNNSVKIHGLGIKKNREHDIIIQRSSIRSAKQNVTFIAYNGNIFNRGSSIIAALKIVLDAKGGLVEIYPFVAQTNELAAEAGIKGLGFTSSITTHDKTNVQPSLVMATDIDVRASLDANIRGTILQAFNSLNVDARRDINITYERVEHYVKSEAFSASLIFFGSSAINNMIAGDCEKAARALLHEFPLLASFDNLAKSKDTADISGNTIHAIYQSYKHLKEMEETGKDLAEVLKGQIKFDPRLRLGGSSSKKYWTELLNTWLLAQRIILKAGRDVNLSAVQIKAEDLQVTAERDINVQSGVQESRSKANDGGVSFNLSGLPVGIDGSHAHSEGLHHIFSELKLKNTASFISGRTLSFKNVELQAARIYLDAENLNLETVLDTQNAENTSAKLDINSAAISHQKISEQFAKKQTTLRALDEFVGHVGHSTSIKGSIIDALRGELNTPELKTENVEGRKTSKSISFGITDIGGFSQPQAFVKGISDTNVNLQKIKQNNKATISKNIHIITQSDIKNLNRDLTRAQEISRKGTHVRIVLPIPQQKEELKTESTAQSNQSKSTYSSQNFEPDLATNKNIIDKKTNIASKQKTETKKHISETITNQNHRKNKLLNQEHVFWDLEKNIGPSIESADKKNFLGLKLHTSSSLQTQIKILNGEKVAFDISAGVRLANGEQTFEGKIGDFRISGKFNGNIDGPTAKLDAGVTFKVPKNLFDFKAYLLKESFDINFMVDAMVYLAGVSGKAEGEICFKNRCLTIDLNGSLGGIGAVAAYGRGISGGEKGIGASVQARKALGYGWMVHNKSIKVDYYKVEDESEKTLSTPQNK